MRRLATPLALAAALALLASGCIQIERASRVYPAAPAGATEVLHVAPDGDDEAPGTAAQPLGSIQAALDAAPPGAAVLVTGGDYGEELAISRSVHLVGDGDAHIGLAGLSIVLHVSGPETEATLRGVHLFGAVTASALIKGASVTLEDCVVQGGDVSVALNEGLGVVAANGAHVVLVGGQVGGHAGAGVVAHQASLEIYGTEIVQNGLGGVLIEDAPTAALLDEVTLTENDVFGVAAMGSDLVVARSLVEQTLGGGDGVVAGPSASAPAGLVAIGGPAAGAALGLDEGAACGNQIRDNQRFGVLLDGASGAVTGNEIEGNGSGGLWVQHEGGTVDVAENALLDNGMVGVAVAADALVNVVFNSIETTRAVLYQLGDEDFGDGVAVLDGGVALIDQNTIRASDRAGVFLSWVGDGTTLGLNTFVENLTDVLCQGEMTCGAGLAFDGAPGQGGGGDAGGGGADAPAHETDWEEVQDEDAAAPTSSFGYGAAEAASDDAAAVIDDEDDEDDEDDGE